MKGVVFVLLILNVYCGPNEADVSEADLTQIQNEYMERSNYYREKHQVPPLCICPNETIKAYRYARHLVKIGKLEHSPDGGFGYSENLAMSMGGLESGNFSVDRYYSQSEHYNYYGAEPSDMDNKKVYEQFTALVWKSSRKIGFAWASDRFTYYYVTQLYPAGNSLGYFKINVLPPHK